ncbi:hypothetical protein [uncultured Pseudokineococcus sp.]|uniref:hypothetical protein n=1 Tax=uncultured Pseudokineococcus sp. TaxID=1642928 RepID=UPI00262EB645|nr:hypothetical protein [uncultured Pseudokineococcus sp.]
MDPTTLEAPESDDVVITPGQAWAELLGAVKRPAAPVRNSFVQRPRDDKAGRDQQRGALLSVLVRGHQTRALDGYLALLALERLLGPDEPWHSKVWARLLATSDVPIPEASVSRTWKQLEDHGLIERTRRRRQALVRPRLEDASGPYIHLGTNAEVQATGGWPVREAYFQVPHDYWLQGHHRHLSLAGKAMLLVALQATGRSPDFYLPQESAPAWYGLSAETVQRGIAELKDLDVLSVRHERIPAARAPEGYTVRHHYTPTGPYALKRRQAASKATTAQIRARQAGTQGQVPA